VRADLEIECKEPDIVVKSIRPDMAEAGKFKVGLKASRKSVKLTVEAGEIGALLAGINSYARLIKTSADIGNLEE
jgi:tRNA threonylcarbamoyladenosine modification (KEOPS) complex  Pcc1 subunit